MWLVPRGVSRNAMVVALAFAPVAVPTEARAEEPTWGLQVFGGAHLTSENSSLGAGKASSISSYVFLGPRLWQRMSSWAALEAEVPMGLTTSVDQVSTLFLITPRMHTRLSVAAEAPVSPFFLAGGGVPVVLSSRGRAVQNDILGAGYAGVGLDIKMRRLAVRLEGRAMVLPATGDRIFVPEWEALVTFGLRDDPSAVSDLAPPLPPDEDKDGVADGDDKCPDQKEDLDGHEDDDGCPELDNDGDGVLDGLDNCQGKMETRNGFQDDDGCPDELPKTVRLLEGVVTGLHFAAGSAQLDTETFVELDKVAELLRKQDSIRIEIVGHTDDREAEDLQALAEERAQVVRKYLLDRGIGAGRLLPRGSADQEPVADNDTLLGRRSNRRVELQVVRE